MLVGLCTAAPLVAQDVAPTARPVPTTISKQAQDCIRNAPPIPPAPRNLDEWITLQARVEEDETPRSRRALEEYAASVEIRKLGGVDVHVITPKRLDRSHADKAIIDIHGGGFCTLSVKSSYFVTAILADATGLRV